MQEAQEGICSEVKPQLSPVQDPQRVQFWGDQQGQGGGSGARQVTQAMPWGLPSAQDQQSCITGDRADGTAQLRGALGQDVALTQASAGELVPQSAVPGQLPAQHPTLRRACILGWQKIDILLFGRSRCGSPDKCKGQRGPPEPLSLSLWDIPPWPCGKSEPSRAAAASHWPHGEGEQGLRCSKTETSSPAALTIL